MVIHMNCGEIKLHGLLDNKLINVGRKIGGEFAYSEMVGYFRERRELFAFGEYWGKLVRGACLAYKYSADTELKRVLLETAGDMLEVKRQNGNLSACDPALQPKGKHGSDIWERKYIIVGFVELYLAFGNEEFLECARDEVLILADQVGEYPKTPITETGWAFYGIESSTVLDPVMRVYELTKDENVLAFARYIVESGCCKRGNIFEQILSGVRPADIGSNGNRYESIAKAYEMMNCVEGLAKYYEATGDDKHLRCAVKFLDMLFEDEITELGSGGADAPLNLGKAGRGEQWNLTRYNQANPTVNKTMETCVTVYFIKLCYTVFRMTGNMKYMEKIERSFYNLLLGALSPEEDYFDYFMRFNGKRHGDINFHHTVGGKLISCCSANGITGVEMFPELMCTVLKSKIYINLYNDADFAVNTERGVFKASAKTEYPRLGKYVLSIKESFDGNLMLRIPSFAKNTVIKLNGKHIKGKAGEYAEFEKLRGGEKIELEFDIPLIAVKIPCSDGKIIYEYGNIVLARDKRYDGKYAEPMHSYDSFKLLVPEGEELVRIGIGEATLIDYKSAGGTWDERSEYNSILTLADGETQVERLIME